MIANESLTEFSIPKLVDKADCSFEIPDFTLVEQDRAWNFPLTTDQRLEILCLLNEVRWGKGCMSRKIDRTKMESLTMDEFNRVKEIAYREDQAWLADAEKRFYKNQK